MKEIFKDVKDYERLYQVSNLGRVKSLSKVIIRGNNIKQYRKENVLKPTPSSNKYLTVGLYKNNNKTTFTVHQLVAIAFLNHKVNGFKLVVDHIDFNRLNNRVDNLKIITTRENTNQKHLNSRSKYVGVCWNSGMNKWQSRIVINKVRKHLGYFHSEMIAGAVYQRELNEILN